MKNILVAHDKYGQFSSAGVKKQKYTRLMAIGKITFHSMWLNPSTDPEHLQNTLVQLDQVTQN